MCEAWHLVLLRILVSISPVDVAYVRQKIGDTQLNLSTFFVSTVTVKSGIRLRSIRKLRCASYQERKTIQAPKA